MALIKSALEMALERAAKTHANPEALLRDKAEKQGASMAAKSLHEQDYDLAVALTLLDTTTQHIARQSALKTLLSNIVLPMREQQLNDMQRVMGVLARFAPQSQTALDQISQFLQTYWTQRNETKTKIEQHFAPTLRKKEQKIAQQTGRHVVLSVDNDPEVQAAYKEQMHLFNDHYKNALEQGKWQLMRILELPLPDEL
jgi:hypothetical protein